MAQVIQLELLPPGEKANPEKFWVTIARKNSEKFTDMVAELKHAEKIEFAHCLSRKLGSITLLHMMQEGICYSIYKPKLEEILVVETGVILFVRLAQQQVLQRVSQLYRPLFSIPQRHTDVAFFRRILSARKELNYCLKS